MVPSDFKIFHSVKSYDKKNSLKIPKFYVAEKRIISKLSKLLIPNFKPYLLYFLRNKPSKSVTVGSGSDGWAGSSFYRLQLVLKWS